MYRLLYFDIKNAPRNYVKVDHFNPSISEPREPTDDNNAEFQRNVQRLSGWTAEELDLLLADNQIPGKKSCLFQILKLYILLIFN